MNIDKVVNKNIKYPKSTNNIQCIGPCYKPKTWIIHPITLDYITDMDDPFCPTNVQEKKLPNGKLDKVYIDTCNIPTHQKDISKKDMEMSMLIPHIEFNSNEFLKIYYNIFSFEDVLNWLDKNSHLSINTKIRVIESAFIAYGKTLDMIDYRLVNFFIDLIKYKWINHIYNKLNKYINIVNNNIIIINPSDNKLNNEEHLIVRMNYIIDSFSEIEIHKFLEKYIKYSIDNINNNDFNLNKIKINLIDYFEQKMLKTLDK
jgi:hypothetical protein